MLEVFLILFLFKLKLIEYSLGSICISIYTSIEYKIHEARIIYLHTSTKCTLYEHHVLFSLHLFFISKTVPVYIKKFFFSSASVPPYQHSLVIIWVIMKLTIAEYGFEKYIIYNPLEHDRRKIHQMGFFFTWMDFDQLILY